MMSNQKNLTATLVLACLLGSAPALGQTEKVKTYVVPASTVSSTERHFEQRRWAEAKGGLEDILKDERYGDDPRFNFMYGKCLLQTGAIKDARKRFSIVKERDETFAKAYFGLARTYAKPAGPDSPADIPRAKENLLEAMNLGFDVLGRLEQTLEFVGVEEIQGAQFTRKLLEAQVRFKFVNLDRTDPFNVPLELKTPPPGSLTSRTWNRKRQEAFVRRMEELWAEASRLIKMADPEQVEIGLDRYTELVREISVSGEMITQPEYRVRLQVVKTEMEERKRYIKGKILERFVAQGKKILTAMKVALNNKEFDEVIRIFEEELVALADNMVITDEDFRDIANEILGKGEVMLEKALVGKEIEALQLEVLGVIISPDTIEIDPEGNETGMHKRATIILNKTETWTHEERPQPENWPPQRKYFIGNSVGQIKELKIQKIERTKVVCLYKERYEIDLDLKVRDVEKEEK